MKWRNQPQDWTPLARGVITGLGLLAVAILYVAHANLFRQYVNDDAFITFRYSRFLAMGRGPYYNPGEHVEGYTNLLLMLLLAPVIRIGGAGAALPAAKVIGLFSGLISILLVYRLARRLYAGDRSAPPAADLCGLLAAGLVAAEPGFAVNSMSGLETTLFACCVTAGVTTGVLGWKTGRWQAAAVAFGAGALTRPEGILVFAVYWIAVALSVRFGARPERRLQRSHKGLRTNPACKHLALVGGAVALVAAAQLVFRLVAYDGEWLPNTYYAKAGGFWGTGAWSYIQRNALLPFLGLFGTAAGLAGFLSRRGLRQPGWPVMVVALGGSFLPFVMGTDWMIGGRLVAPYLPLLSAVVATGWCAIAATALRKPGWLGPAVLLLCIPAVWVIQAKERTMYSRYVATRAQGYRDGHAALANWLGREQARPGDTVALVDIGIIGYSCIEQRILDISGLTDQYVAKQPGVFLQKKFDPSYVLNPRTRFVVIVLTARIEPTPERILSTPLHGWIPMEMDLVLSPEFRRWYVHFRPPVPSGSPWPEVLAQRWGAERIFQHAYYPAQPYLLAVFRRLDSPNP